MLHDVVGNFLDTLTEREFDGPLLAVLTAQGFTDVHFIHGAFEFGKDVIAKKVNVETGETRQYSIQSKAGDINLAGWREVRPQLEEAEYNTQAHPSFDPALPRVAVLVTTGRLKGAAAVDASEFKKAMGSRGLADFDVWDRLHLLNWICNDPLIGLAGAELQLELLTMVTKILSRTITEPEIERHSRRWFDESGRSAPASIETAILVNALRETHRLDLAAMTAVQLIRAAHCDPDVAGSISDSARRLFAGLACELLTQVEPLLSDPLDVARATFHPMSVITYPVTCCRLGEIVGLLVIASAEAGDGDMEARATAALVELSRQPGTARPPSDAFAASVIAVAVALKGRDPAAAGAYLHAVSKWLLDRYDQEMAGLGLASLHEDEEHVAARLLGGSLSSTELERRNSSYLAVAILDLCLFLGVEDLYEAVRDNLSALRVVPEATRADESLANWRRGGADVWPQPRVDFEGWIQQSAQAAPVASGANGAAAVLLASACRSRHYRSSWREVSGHLAP